MDYGPAPEISRTRLANILTSTTEEFAGKTKNMCAYAGTRTPADAVQAPRLNHQTSWIRLDVCTLNLAWRKSCYASVLTVAG